MKSSTFWDVLPCSPLKVSQVRNRHEADSKLSCLLHAVFLPGLLFNPEDGSGMFL
jgi:hypothetical protein